MGVPYRVVIDVLSKTLPNASISFSVEGNKITIIKDGMPEVTFLPEDVPVKMIHRFHRLYGVRIEFFFHPEMLGNQ